MIRRALLGLLPLALVLPAAAQQLGKTEMTRTWTLEKKGGQFTAKIRDILASAEIKSFAVRIDWWNGGEDARVGDRTAAEREKYEVEIRHGKVWQKLGTHRRDLRLEVLANSPKEALEGDAVRGEWVLRVKGGKERPERAWLSVTFLVPFGKGLAQPDLRVAAIEFTETEKYPPAKGRYPIKRHFPEIEPGKTYATRVHLVNAGYGDVPKCTIAMHLTDEEGKGRKNLPEIDVDVMVREQETLRRKWKFRAPKKLKPGLYHLHAACDPGGRVKELDEANNRFSRIVRVNSP
jgi:hypothetical protein